MSVYLVFGGSAALLCSLIASLYPSYASLNAISAGDELATHNWIVYWVVFAQFSMLDVFCDRLFGYYLIKTLFLLFLALPATNGARILHQHVIIPLGSRIDQL